MPVDPIHGQANCSQQPDAVYCSLTCHDGYAFAMPPPRNYFCAYDGQWLPADSPLPFLNCSVMTHSDALIQDGVLRLTGDSPQEEDKICQDPFLMSQMEGHFKRRLAARLNEICGDNMICQVDDLQAECRQVVAESDDVAEDEDYALPTGGPVDWEQSNEIPRAKRSVENIEIPKKKTGKSKSGLMTLELRFKVLSKLILLNNQIELITIQVLNTGRFNQKNGTDGTTTTLRTTTLTPANLTQDLVLNELNQLRALLTQSALSGEFNVNYTAGRLLNVFDVQFQGDVERPKYSCPTGSMPVKSGSSDDFARCVYCLVGTFFNVVDEVRQSCSQGSW